ncbi:MAG: ABC transporter substrate-binding protein [Rhodocyclales bacterium]|nr:ABC transporter substrate-binding protein [Rhodocyclales bacterium]
MKRLVLSCLAGLLLCGNALAAPPAAASASGNIVLGQSLPLTGAIAEVGINYQKGILLAFEQANAKGGINGRKIELVSLDDGYDPKRAEENTRKLIDEKQVLALFGYVGTGTTIASQAIAEKAGVPMIAPLTGADALRAKPANNIYFLRASYGEEMEKIVEHQATLGIGKIALIYQNDAFGKGAQQSFEEAMRRHNLTPAAVIAADPQGGDIPAAMAEIARVKPMAVVLGTAGKLSTSLVKALQQSGVRPQVFGLSVMSPANLRAELQASVAGVVMAQVVPSPTSSKHTVVRQYRAALGDKVNEAHHNGLEGYIAGRMMVEALRRAKDASRGALLEAMSSMRKLEVADFIVDFGNPRHTGSRYLELAILRADGTFGN